VSRCTASCVYGSLCVAAPVFLGAHLSPHPFCILSRALIEPLFFSSTATHLSNRYPTSYPALPFFFVFRKLIPLSDTFEAKIWSVGALECNLSLRIDFNEKPSHQVTLTEPFFIGVTEVTVAQYRQFDPGFKRHLDSRTADDDAASGVTCERAVAFCE
jgi:hypothetical protein